LRKVLRTIYDPKIVDGVYRNSYNFGLDGEFNSPNVIGVVKSNRYAGHMIRVAEDLPQRALFKAKPEGRQNPRKTEIQVNRWHEQ
jgi:hypothetical protein